MGRGVDAFERGVLRKAYYISICGKVLIPSFYESKPANLSTQDNSSYMHALVS